MKGEDNEKCRFFADDVIRTKDDFARFVKQFWGTHKKPQAFGLCVSKVDKNGNPLDAHFPVVNYNENFGSAAVFAKVLSMDSSSSISSETVTIGETEMFDEMLEYFYPFEKEEGHANIDIVRDMRSALNTSNWVDVDKDEEDYRRKIRISCVFIYNLSSSAQSLEEAYLRLLLSKSEANSNDINLNGIHDILPELVWTNEGPYTLDEAQRRQTELALRGKNLTIHKIANIPRTILPYLPG